MTAPIPVREVVKLLLAAKADILAAAEEVDRSATNAERLGTLHATVPRVELAATAVEDTRVRVTEAEAEAGMEVEDVRARLATLVVGTDTCLVTVRRDRSATTVSLLSIQLAVRGRY